MTEAQIAPKAQVTGPKTASGTNGSNGKAKWFGAKLWDATTTAIANRSQASTLKDRLTTTDEQLKDAWTQGIAKDAKGNPQVAKLVIDVLLKAGGEYATKLIDQFIKLYPTLSQAHRAKIFGKLVDEFCMVTSKGLFSELKAVNLARIIEVIGKESKTTYAEDEGPLFSDNVDRLARRLKDIVEDDFKDYHEQPAVRAACARIVWAFDNDLQFLEQRLHDAQTAEFAVEAMISTSDGRAMLVAKVLNGDSKLIANVMAGMPEEKIRNQLLGWIYRGEHKLAIYALNVIAMRKSLSMQLKLVIKSKINDRDVDVKNAAVAAAVRWIVPEAIPHLKESLGKTENVQIKDACISAIARFAVHGNEDAKQIILDVLNGTDNQAKNLAIGHILVNKLTYTIPTMMALFENKRGDKAVRANIEKAVLLFGLASAKEAIAVLPRIAEIRKQELNARIFELKHTAMQGRNGERTEATAELQGYAKRGAKAAATALHEIDRAKERNQPWKRRGKQFF